MRAFRFPAAYQRHVERALEHALHEVDLDQRLRADNASRARVITLLDDTEIDAASDGACVVVVLGVSEADANAPTSRAITSLSEAAD